MGKLKQKAFWIALGDFSGRGFSFITSIYLARTLGSEFYGLIVIAISILGYCTWFADLGMINLAVREVAKEPVKRLFRAREIFNMKVLLGIIVLVISLLIVSNLEMEHQKKSIILSYLYSLIPYAILMEWYYNGRQQFGKVAASKALNGLVYLVLVFLLVHKQEDVALVPYLYLGGISAATILLGFFSIFEKPFPLPSRGLNIYSDLLKTSSILGVGWFFTQLIQLLPPILIGVFLSLNDAGIYGAAYRILLILMLLDRVFVNILLPNLAAVWAVNKDLAKKQINLVLKLIIVGGSLITTLLVFNSETIVSLLFGPSFGASVIILKYLSVFILFTFINSLFSFGLIAIGKDQQYLQANVLGGSVSAVLIVLFTSFGTPVSAAIAVSLSELVILLCSYYWFKKNVELNFFKPLTLIVIPTIIFFVVVTALQIHALFASLAYVAFLAFVSWATGTIRKEEIQWINRNWAR